MTDEQITQAADKIFGDNSATERYKGWVDGAKYHRDHSANVIEQVSGLRDEITKEIIECNEYLFKRNDCGQLARKDDFHESISFTRGKSVGLVISRDKLNKILNEVK